MKTTIDGAGRLVVPKVFRDQLKLTAGTEVEVRVLNGVLEIEPAPTAMRLVQKGKGWVATSEKALPTIGAQQVRAVTESLRK